jgi:hypothetical protein
MALAVHRRGALLHRFEKRRLRLGGGTVDLVGEEEVGEQRPGAEAELAARRIEIGMPMTSPGSRSRELAPKRTSRHAASARTINVLPIPGTLDEAVPEHNRVMKPSATALLADEHRGERLGRRA